MCRRSNEPNHLCQCQRHCCPDGDMELAHNQLISSTHQHKVLQLGRVKSTVQTHVCTTRALAGISSTPPRGDLKRICISAAAGTLPKMCRQPMHIFCGEKITDPTLFNALVWPLILHLEEK